MRDYELTVILDKEETKTLADVVVKAGGEVGKKTDPVKKDLAYEINKKKTGWYVYWEIKIKPEDVKKLEQALKLEAGVIRYLVVKKS